MRSSFLHPHSSPPNVAVASSHPQQSLLSVSVPCFIGIRCSSHPGLFLVAKNIKHSSKDRAHLCTKSGENNGSLLPDVVEEEDEGCPVDCVREFYTDEEFTKILEKAKETHALVVVDFYRTSCGSCKYIEQGFVRLCKGSNDPDTPVVFLKHNFRCCQKTKWTPLERSASKDDNGNKRKRPHESLEDLVALAEICKKEDCKGLFIYETETSPIFSCPYISDTSRVGLGTISKF